MTLNIIYILSLITIVFCFFAIASLCYRRGWMLKQRQTFRLMTLTIKELKKIIDNKNLNPETIEVLISWRKFSLSILNSKEPEWIDFIK